MTQPSGYCFGLASRPPSVLGLSTFPRFAVRSKKMKAASWGQHSKNGKPMVGHRMQQTTTYVYPPIFFSWGSERSKRSTLWDVCFWPNAWKFAAARRNCKPPWSVPSSPCWWQACRIAPGETRSGGWSVTTEAYGWPAVRWQVMVLVTWTNMVTYGDQILKNSWKLQDHSRFGRIASSIFF